MSSTRISALSAPTISDGDIIEATVCPRCHDIDTEDADFVVCPKCFGEIMRDKLTPPKTPESKL